MLGDDIAGLDDVSEDDDVAFDDNLFAATSHSEMDERMCSSLQSAKDAIKRFTADEFINEAYMAATQLRNTLGDADGLAADLAETIRSNLMVLVQAITKEPLQFVLSALQAETNEQKRRIMASKLLTQLTEFTK